LPSLVAAVGQEATLAVEPAQPGHNLVEKTALPDT
jgi:hypothetical protein